MLACVHIILIYNSRGDGANRCFLHASPFSKAFSRKKSSSIAIYLYPRNTNSLFSINPFSRKVSSSEIFPFDEEDPLFYWNKERKGGERNGCIEDEKFGGARFISAK